jgi:hypothetical protein
MEIVVVGLVSFFLGGMFLAAVGHSLWARAAKWRRETIIGAVSAIVFLGSEVATLLVALGVL